MYLCVCMYVCMYVCIYLFVRFSNRVTVNSTRWWSSWIFLFALLPLLAVGASLTFHQPPPTARYHIISSRCIASRTIPCTLCLHHIRDELNVCMYVCMYEFIYVTVCDYMRIYSIFNTQTVSISIRLCNF